MLFASYACRFFIFIFCTLWLIKKLFDGDSLGKPPYCALIIIIVCFPMQPLVVVCKYQESIAVADSPNLAVATPAAATQLKLAFSPAGIQLHKPTCTSTVSLYPCTLINVTVAFIGVALYQGC